jgi:hypothetical protein
MFSFDGPKRFNIFGDGATLPISGSTIVYSYRLYVGCVSRNYNWWNNFIILSLPYFWEDTYLLFTPSGGTRVLWVEIDGPKWRLVVEQLHFLA